MSQEQVENLLGNCSTAQEKLLILVLRDLDSSGLPVEEITIPAIDRATGLIRSGSGQNHSPVRLQPDTLAALNKHLNTRRDNGPALFLTTDGQRLTSTEIVQLAVQIGAQAGLEFDQEKMRFHKQGQDQPRRVVAKGASRDLFYLYGIVSNPLRRQIVEMLGDEGPSGFTQIRKRLNVPVGTLYYHFDMLSALVTQDEQKRYTLTDIGRDAYQKLHSPEYVQSSELLSGSTGSQLSPVERGLRLLVPATFLASLQRRNLFPVLAAATILVTGSVSTYLAGLETVVLFVNPANQTYLLPVEFLLNWLIVYGVADLLATYLFARKGEHLTLLTGTAYAILPLLVFAGWWQVAVAFSLNALGLSTFALSRIILVLLQAWSLGMLARIVSVVKGLRLDKAAIISLAIAYLSITIALLRGV